MKCWTPCSWEAFSGTREARCGAVTQRRAILSSVEGAFRAQEAAPDCPLAERLRPPPPHDGRARRRGGRLLKRRLRAVEARHSARAAEIGPNFDSLPPDRLWERTFPPCVSTALHVTTGAIPYSFSPTDHNKARTRAVQEWWRCWALMHVRAVPRTRQRLPSHEHGTLQPGHVSPRPGDRRPVSIFKHKRSSVHSPR